MARGKKGEEIAHYHELTPQQRAILDALKMGNTRTASAAYAGIHKDTFYEWLKTNPTFSDAVTHAEAIAEVGHVGVLATSAMRGDWRASLEWLKRRRRDDWGDNIAVRADREAAVLLAALFPDDAGAGAEEATPGTAETIHADGSGEQQS